MDWSLHGKQSTEITSNTAIPFRKISDSTNLAEGVREVSPLEGIRLSEMRTFQRIARSNMMTMLQHQLKRYKARMPFLSQWNWDSGSYTISRLNRDKPYTFKVIQANCNKVYFVAVPVEPGGKSYTAAIEIARVNGKETAFAKMCVSSKPSKNTFESPKLRGNDLTCPTGTQMPKGLIFFQDKIDSSVNRGN